MILVFTGANGLYLSHALNQEFRWGAFACALLLMLSFFFRMRCFDEIKDYEVDLRINPTRPLARGVLSIVQVKRGLFAMIAFELLLSGTLGFWPFVIHTLAVFYSLLMYEEFFIGDWLRPYLTTYAVTHTFVSALLGLSVGVTMTSFDVRQLTPPQVGFFLMNWAFFNLFEFARKTFAASEERPTISSYSNIFTPRGAWALSWSQVIAGVVLACWSLQDSPRVSWIVAGGIVYTLISVFYFVKPLANNAKLFRTVTGIYLLGHYILVCLALGATHVSH